MGCLSELFQKIKKRRRKGEADDDEGYSQSPGTPTTADVLMESALAKSKNTMSDGSLLSMDSQDNELEDEFFKSKWSTNQTSPEIDGNVDLDVVTSTSSLVSTGARHKLAVKPPRRRAGLGQRRAVSPTTAAPLEQVTEERPSSAASHRSEARENDICEPASVILAKHIDSAEKISQHSRSHSASSTEIVVHPKPSEKKEVGDKENDESSDQRSIASLESLEPKRTERINEHKSEPKEVIISKTKSEPKEVIISKAKSEPKEVIISKAKSEPKEVIISKASANNLSNNKTESVVLEERTSKNTEAISKPSPPSAVLKPPKPIPTAKPTVATSHQESDSPFGSVKLRKTGKMDALSDTGTLRPDPNKRKTIAVFNERNSKPLSPVADHKVVKDDSSSVPRRATSLKQPSSTGSSEFSARFKKFENRSSLIKEESKDSENDTGKGSSVKYSPLPQKRESTASIHKKDKNENSENDTKKDEEKKPETFVISKDSSDKQSSRAESPSILVKKESLVIKKSSPKSSPLTSRRESAGTSIVFDRPSSQRTSIASSSEKSGIKSNNSSFKDRGSFKQSAKTPEKEDGGVKTVIIQKKLDKPAISNPKPAPANTSGQPDWLTLARRKTKKFNDASGNEPVSKKEEPVKENPSQPETIVIQRKNPEEDSKKEAEERKKQEEIRQKAAEDEKKAAEEKKRKEDERKKEEEKKRVEEAKKKAEEEKKKREEQQKKAEEEKKKREEQQKKTEEEQKVKEQEKEETNVTLRTSSVKCSPGDRQSKVFDLMKKFQNAPVS